MKPKNGKSSSPYHSEEGSFFIYLNYAYARQMAVVRIAACFFTLLVGYGFVFVFLYPSSQQQTMAEFRWI